MATVNNVMSALLSGQSSLRAHELRLTPPGGSRVFLSCSRMPWISVDFVLALAFFIIGSWFEPRYRFPNLPPDTLLPAVFNTVIFCVIATGLGFFDRSHRFHWASFLKYGVLAFAVALPLTLLAIHFAFFVQIGRVLLIYGSLCSMLAVLGCHSILALAVGRFPHRILVLGPRSALIEEILEHACHRGNGDIFVECVGQLDPALEADRQTLAQSPINDPTVDVILTQGSGRSSDTIHSALQCMKDGCRVLSDVDLYMEVFERVPVKNVSTQWLLEAGINIHKPFTNFIKRVTDVVGATFLLVVGAPLMALIALAIKLTSPGPAIFMQPRQGRYLKPFKILKFRTMQWQDPSMSGPPSTRLADARITWIGRLLRPLHLDELPQLWNILKGEMSFIGPRPEVLSFANSIVADVPIYEFRHLVRPGLSGMSQIKVGYTLDNANDTLVKMSFDLYYILNYNLFTDLYVAIQTLFRLTRGSR